KLKVKTIQVDARTIHTQVDGSPHLQCCNAGFFTCTTVIPIGIKIRKLQSLRVIQYNIDVDKLTVVAIDQCPRSVPILIKMVFTGTMYIQFSGAVDLSCRSNPNTTAINMYLPVDLPVRIRTHIQSL